MDAGLIQIDRLEAEKHGILQKFYSPISDVFIIDPDKTPKSVQRYFIQKHIEHLIGIFSVFELNHNFLEVSSKSFEHLAMAMWRELKLVGEKHIKDSARGEAKSLKVKIYAEALANLTKQKEWKSLFRDLLDT